MKGQRAHPTRRIRALALPLFSLSARPAPVPAHRSRAGDLQFGGGFALATPPTTFNKLSLTGAQPTPPSTRAPTGASRSPSTRSAPPPPTVYERSYEVRPPRLLPPRTPRALRKVLVGRRRSTNFSGNIANLAYNLYTVGGGADFALTPTINLRADYEGAELAQLPPRHPRPNLFTVGAAYHFRIFPKPPR